MTYHPFRNHFLVASGALILCFPLLGAISQVNDQTFAAGEFPAVDGKIKVENFQYEIDGVCKFGENSAICWKPNGEPNQSLSDRFTSIIQHPTTNQPFTYTVTFLKKKRFLILKKSQVNQVNSLYSYGRVSSDGTYTGAYKEGWSEHSGTNFTASFRDFDGSETTRSTIEGTFEPGTKEFPLRYEFTNQSQKPIVKKLEIGKFEVDGNLFEITSIADHPKPGPGQVDSNNYYYPYQAEPKTDVAFCPISIANKFSSFTMQVGDEAGNSFYYVDEKGDPASNEVVTKWNQENIRYNSDKPLPKNPYRAVGVSMFDPRETSPPITTRKGYFGINKEKCKSLVISASKRSVYVFEHVKLDPN
jgi:hypothetical protein